MINRRVFRVTVATDEVQSFLAGCEASEWFAHDTGERIMTDDGPEAEAVLLVEPTMAPLSGGRTVVPLLH